MLDQGIVRRNVMYPAEPECETNKLVSAIEPATPVMVDATDDRFAIAAVRPSVRSARSQAERVDLIWRSGVQRLLPVNSTEPVVGQRQKADIL
ncbi:MAG: hypothetical protein ACK8QZ_11575 [Anaerolineales bacterium]